MENQGTLLVDFTNEKSVSQLLPYPPLLTSHKLGWTGIQVQQHQQPAWETPEYKYSQHMILVHQDHLTRTNRVLDGKVQQERFDSEEIVLVPAQVSNQVRWDRETRFTILSLEPAHLAHIAHESVDRDRLSLVPHFATPDPLIHQIGIALKSELENNGLGSRLYVDALTTTLSIHLLRNYAVSQPKIPTYTGGLPKHKLQQVMAYIDSYLAQNLTLEEIAKTVGMSQFHFARMFKQSIGVTPYQYVIQKRVERVKHLLKFSPLPIADICLQCGFNSQSHCYFHFQRLVGVTPKKFRQS
jgi:AraC family transcriptional regulator